MRTSLNGILTLLLAFIVHLSFAQEKVISGTVTDQDGLALPGVNILVEGTTTGTQTDFDGNYTISASVGQTLLFTYIGQRAERRTVGADDTINVQMQEDAQALEEVVVTALGIKREKQALGYAVSEVDSDQLESRPEGDIGRVLTGKASGVQITNQSGLSGSGTNVIIRGLSTFSSSNQALFIVDGVPFSSDTNSQGRQGDRNDFYNGNNGSSRFLDLDPNSIESVNVLKGLAAATLYGSQGRNGVVLITTKAGAAGATGPKKTEITVNTSIFFNEIASLPDYQQQYGGGFDQNFGWFFSNWGPSFQRGGAAGWGNQPAIDNQGTLAHPYSPTYKLVASVLEAFPEFANARYDWKPYASVENFFRTGTVTNTSVNVAGTSDDGKIGYNINYGNLSDQGFTLNNKVLRNNLSVGGRAQLSNKFTAAGTLNFARTSFTSPPVAYSSGSGVAGAGSSIFGDVFYTPISVDLIGLPYQNPITGGSVYYRQTDDIQHPLWTAYNAASEQETNRVYGQASLQYDINDNLNVIYRAGLDIYSENNVNFQNRGGTGGDGNLRTQSGFYETWNNTNTIWDHNLVLNGDYDITDLIGATFNVGATSRREIFDQNGVASDGQQVFGVLRHFNFLNQNEIQSFAERNLVGVYGQFDFDYDNWIYLTVAGRNDWVSNFAQDNRAQFYPSASLSFIPTTAFPSLKGNVLDYLKIRGGIGVSANFESANYPIASTLFLDTQDLQDGSGRNIVTNTTGVRLGNPNLQPETLEEIEIGIESRWWDGRITLDGSIYTRKTNDLILDRPLDPATGYTITATNVGEISSDGVEADLGVTWFRADEEGDFSWNSNLNFTAYETTVEDLGLDTDQVIYSGFSNLGNAAIEGEPLGVLFGSRVARNDNDELLVGADGNYLTDADDGIIGDPNPDWVANLINTLSYKNFTLGFQWNYTQGGDVYSITAATLLGRGMIVETANREDTYILPGLDPNGNANTVAINNSSYYFSNIFGGPSELQVWDATTLRLQEASLSYSLPSKFLDRTPFGNLTFTVSGQNLWYEAFNFPKGSSFDPNVSGTGVGNGVGFDFLAGPSARRYGFSVKASF